MKILSRRGIEKWITVGVFLLLVGVISLSIYVTIFNLDSIDKLAQNSISDASKLVTERVESYFDALGLFYEMAVNNWNTSEDFYVQALENEAFSRDLVDHYSYIVSLQFGDEDGNFAMYRKDVLGNINTKIIITDKNLPESQRRPRVIWRYYSEDVLLREVMVLGVDYDPRTRPWYIGAQGTDSLFMSEPYEFFTDQVVGITAAHRHEVGGKVVGVYSFDISLDEVVQFMNQLNLTNQSETFIVTSEKKVIGLLDEPLSKRSSSGFVNDLSEKEINLLTAKNIGATQKVTIDSKNASYYVVFNEVLKEFSKPWYIYVRVNQGTTLQKFSTSALLNGILSVSIVVLTLFLVLYNFRQKQVHNQLDTIARKDPLTGLLNRYSIEEISEELMHHYERYGKSFSVLLGDVDRFKRINDTFGHKIGDTVLIGLSEILIDGIRSTDYACRWGGEEFLIVLPGADRHIACNVAKNLLKCIVAKPITTEIGIIEVTMSFGVATYDGTETMTQLINQADKKLYESKENGRNQVSC